MNKKNISKHLLTIVLILTLILIVLGIKIGIKYSPVKTFNYSYNYLQPLDIYGSTLLNYPTIINKLYSFGPIILFGALIYLLISKTTKSLILFIFISSFLLSFFNGGLAFKKADFDREESNFFYQNAPILNMVPDKKFSIYIEEWNKHNNSDRILWIYRIFFDEKYKRIFDAKYKSQYLNENLIKKNISFIKKETNLLDKINGNQVLTDNEKIIYRYFPSAQKIKSIKHNGKTLFILDISQNKKNLIKIDEYKNDFSIWSGPDKITMEELTKTSPPLILSGNRGNFSFQRTKEKNDNIVKIQLIKPHTSEQSVIQFGINGGNIQSPENIIATFNVFARISSDKTSASIFIQDKTDEWERNSTIINSLEWKKYSIKKKFRPGISNISIGINYQPKNKKNWLEIKNINIIFEK